MYDKYLHTDECDDKRRRRRGTTRGKLPARAISTRKLDHDWPITV